MNKDKIKEKGLFLLINKDEIASISFMCTILTFIFTTFLTGYAYSKEKNLVETYVPYVLGEIEQGMSKEEVDKILGGSRLLMKNDTYEEYIYVSIDEDRNMIDFVKDIFSKREKPKLQEFYSVFKKDKLVELKVKEPIKGSFIFPTKKTEKDFIGFGGEYVE